MLLLLLLTRLGHENQQHRVDALQPRSQGKESVAREQGEVEKVSTLADSMNGKMRKGELEIGVPGELVWLDSSILTLFTFE